MSGASSPDGAPSSIEGLFRADVASLGLPIREGLHRLWSQGLPPAELARMRAQIQGLSSGARILHLAPAVSVVEAIRQHLDEARAGVPAGPVERLDRLLSGLDFLDRLCAVADDALPRWLGEHAAEAEELVARLGTGERRVMTAPPTASVSDSQDVARSLLGLFKRELQLHTPAIHAGLDRLATDAESSHAYAPLLRAAHSIRGAAAVGRVEPVERLARAMEEAIAGANEGRRALGPEAPALFRRLAALLERLAVLDETLLRAAASDDPECRALLEALDPVAGRASAPPPAAPPAAEGPAVARRAPTPAQLSTLIEAAEALAAWAEGTPGLPAGPREELVAALRAAVAPLAPPAILVVDDSAMVREIVKKLLEEHGLRVEVAVDGAAGWSAVQGRRFDLVITDMDMPRMGGLELLGHIRAAAELAGLPVIIVSSYRDREDDRRRASAAGADACLPKSSVHDDRLLAEVARLLERKAS